MSSGSRDSSIRSKVAGLAQQIDTLLNPGTRREGIRHQRWQHQMLLTQRCGPLQPKADVIEQVIRPRIGSKGLPLVLRGHRPKALR